MNLLSLGHIWSLEKQRTIYLYLQETYSYQAYQFDGSWQGASPQNVARPTDHAVMGDHVADEKWYISSSLMPKTIKFDRMAIWFFDHVFTGSHLKNKKYYVSISKRALATKLVRVVVYIKGLLHKKPHDPLITFKIKKKVLIPLQNLPYIFTSI